MFISQEMVADAFLEEFKIETQNTSPNSPHQLYIITQTLLSSQSERELSFQAEWRLVLDMKHMLSVYFEQNNTNAFWKKKLFLNDYSLVQMCLLKTLYVIVYAFSSNNDDGFELGPWRYDVIIPRLDLYCSRLKR